MKIFQYLGYLLFRCIIFVFSLIPFWGLYILSNGLAFFLNHVFRYRRKTILENLELTQHALKIKNPKKLLPAIYRNVSDIMLETIKGFSMSKKQIARHHRTLNPELLEPLHETKESVILVTPHYNNWEWGAFSPNFYVQHGIIGLYKPMNNRFIDQYIIKKRAKFGTVLASINTTRQYFDTYASKFAMFLMAADQSPTKPHKAVWVPFLNQPTPCIHGIEQYSKEYNLPIVYADIQRIKRGMYTVELSWIKKTNEILPYGKSTYLFFHRIEKTLMEDPCNWLWSHRRWKHASKFNGTYTYPRN